jgi:tRNA G18 (ribose-2'-O)-methylase SpoU
MNVRIVGIEILEIANNISEYSYKGKIAFMPGNEGTGMSDKQKHICDEFVYISQYGNGTASLNVNVSVSIVLHEYNKL